MSHILHYEEIDGTGEYIVITDDDDNTETREEHCIAGYRCAASYEIENTGCLPTERALVAT